MSTIFEKVSHLSAGEQPVVHVAAEPPASWNDYLKSYGYAGFHLRSEWSDIFRRSLKHRPVFLWTSTGNRITGVLPLTLITGPIFGRFLASQPYLNTGGVLADSPVESNLLVSRAVALADQMNVKQLELRHEQQHAHIAFNATNTEKVHMRLTLPQTSEALWDGLKSKVRSQIRKPLNDGSLTCRFGREDQLSAFYRIFCRNMRDLGTPPFPRSLFGEMLSRFPDSAEICTVSLNGQPVASGFLLHGPGTTLIPSASSFREHNRTSCNMLMYWHALKRSIERGQREFDFGRSSVDAGTHRFKKQWGSKECPATWQYYSRQGDISDARPNSGRFDLMIAAWQKLPVWLTKLVGPTIVRGIP